MKPTRREIGAIGIGTVLGISGLTLTSETSSAAEIDGEFTIPDVDRDITNPVSSLRLTVTGSISWDSDSLPTRAVLRLEVSRSGTFEQLEAEAYSNGLERQHEQSFAFDRVNLLSHPQIQVMDVSPTTAGETNELPLTARLTLEVMKDGSELSSATFEEDLLIGVTKTNGETSIQMGATGEIEIGTSD